MLRLPDDFNAAAFNEIPHGRLGQLYDNDELNELANTAIRKSLEKRLGCPVVPRSALTSRFGLKHLGYTMEQINSGAVKVR